MAGIYVERVGNRIHLTGWIGPKTPGMCKQVGAGRFSKTNGAHWTFPLTVQTCLSLRRVFGESLDMGPELESWSWDAFAADRAARKVAKAHSAKLGRVPSRFPAMAEAMGNRKYQQSCAKFISMGRNVLVTDQPGLGKTIEILAGLCESQTDDKPKFYLIFAPRIAVVSVWSAEILRWIGEDKARVIALTGTSLNRQKLLQQLHEPDSRDTYIVTNIEAVRVKENETYFPELFSKMWDAVVVDESHRALIRKTGKNTQTREGFMLLTRNSRQRIAASGTPMRGKPDQLWGTLNWLRPKEYTSYWHWVAKYFELGNNGFTEHNTVVGDLKRPNALAKSLASTQIRRTKGEVLPELPPKQYAGSYLIPRDKNSPFGVWLELGPKQRKLYTQMATEGVVELDDGEIVANGILAENSRKRMLAGACGSIEKRIVRKMSRGKLRNSEVASLVPVLESVKFDWLVNKLDALGHFEKDNEGERIVVVSQFTSLLNLFERELKRLGVATHKVTGKVTSDVKRAAMIKDFQSDTPSARVFLLNTKSAGVAITLDMADYLVMLDETSIPDDQEQAEDRVHRTSRLHQVTIYYLRVLDTIEEEVAWVAAARADVQTYLLDGTRGVAYARALYEQAA